VKEVPLFRARCRTCAFLTCLILLAILPGPSGSLQAASWTVDANLGHDADFTSPQAANDDARVLHGDVLCVAGCQTSYGDATFTKRLIVRGPGYFLSENKPELNSYSAATLGAVTFTSTPGGPFEDPSSSAGSVMMGINAERYGAIYVNDVTIQRCRMAYALIQGDNCSILQCYMVSVSYYGVHVENADNSLVSNCFFPCGIAISQGSNGAVVQNNVVDIYFQLNSPDSYAANNILLFANPASFVANGIFKNNMLAAAADFLPAGNGNVNHVNPATVFVGTGSTDGKWQLKAGSPALGAGVNGADMGMFGGATPYVLSGLPAIPTVAVDAGPTGTGLSGLRIKVTAQSHN